MSVTNGQKANASTFNNAFLSRTTDSDTTGKVGLKNSDTVSGPHINNVQRAINKAFEGIGTTGEADANINVYSSTNYIANGDSRKTAVEKLDAKAKQLNDDLVDAQNDIASLDTRVTQAESDIVSLDGRVTQNETDITSLQNSVSSITTTLSDHEQRLDDLETGDMTIAGDKVFSGDVEFTGNVEFSGTTTIVNSQDLHVEDSLITINKNGTDLSSEGSGIEIERPSGNARFVFDSTLQSKFKLGVTPNLYEVLVSGIAQTVTGQKTFSDGIKTDSISEALSNNGVTIEGVLINDGLVAGRDVSQDGADLDDAINDIATLQSDVSNINSTLTNHGDRLNDLESGNMTITGNKTFSGILTSQDLLLNGQFSLDAENNNVSGSDVVISSFSKPVIRLTNASLLSVAGLSQQTSRRVVYLQNVTNNVLTLKHDTGAVNEEKILIPTATDIQIQNNAFVKLIYDTDLQRWLAVSTFSVGGGGGGGGGDKTLTFRLNGAYGSATPQNGIDGLVILSATIKIKNVFIYQQVPGSSGTTELDIKWKPFGSGSFTSIFAVTPKVSSTASGNEWCGVGDTVTGFTAPVLVSSPVNIPAKAALRMDLVSKQSGPAAGVGLIVIYEE